jgi:hypothetical protein
LGWRRVVSLVVFVGALAVGAKLFDATVRGPVPVEIHYLLGDPPRATRLEVSFAREAGGEPVARFETELVAPDVKQITRLPAGRHVMDITMTGPNGTRRTVWRSIEASRDVVIRLELAREAPTP